MASQYAAAAPTSSPTLKAPAKKTTGNARAYSAAAKKAASPTASTTTKKQRSNRPSKPFPRQVASATRQFTPLPQDSNPGFQYLYLPSRNKETLPRLRDKLAYLKVNNWRVLDIHFPARQVVALLVHNDYASELCSLFAAAGITPLVDFNPLDPQHLNDPRLASLPAEALAHKVLLVHQGRLRRGLKFIRSLPVRHAVAADFCSRHWISEAQLLEVRKSGTFTIEGDADPSAPGSGSGSGSGSSLPLVNEDATMNDVSTPPAPTRLPDGGESEVTR
ncbi:MAG: hypothetical protein EXX96DRAFT_579264, partial [Benjaminiella poitrasii]